MQGKSGARVLKQLLHNSHLVGDAIALHEARADCFYVCSSTNSAGKITKNKPMFFARKLNATGTCRYRQFSQLPCTVQNYTYFLGNFEFSCQKNGKTEVP